MKTLYICDHCGELFENINDTLYHENNCLYNIKADEIVIVPSEIENVNTNQ